MNNLTAGGTIFCKEITWNSSITLPNSVLVVESYLGQMKTYTNQGRWLLVQLSADPDTSGWGVTERGRWWFNTADNRIKYWDGDEIQVLPSTGGGGTSVTLPFAYTIYKTGSTYYMQDSEGNIDYSSTNASKVERFADGNLTSGGSIYVRRATYSLDKGWYIHKKTQLIAEPGTILSMTGNAHAITIDTTNTQYTNWRVENFQFDMNQVSGNCISGTAGGYTAGDCQETVSNCFFYDIKASYWAINVTDIFGLHVIDCRIDSLGNGIAIYHSGSVANDYGHGKIENTRISIEGANGIGIYICGNGATHSAFNFGVLDEVSILGNGAVAGQVGLWIDEDNKIEMVGGTIEGSQTLLLLDDSFRCQFLNTHIGSGYGSGGYAVRMIGNCYGNMFSGGWFYTAAAGTAWSDESTSTSESKNFIDGGAYVAVGSKDFSSTTKLGEVNIYISGSDVGYAMNSGKATSKVNGDTISHNLYTATNSTVIVTASSVGVVASVTSIGATTFQVGLQWRNGTLVDANHTPQTVYWYAEYNPS
jgi:hypothetical protein